MATLTSSVSYGLTVAAVGLQGVGVLAAGIGLRQTWAEFHAPSETFYGPPMERIRRWVATVRAASSRFLRAILRLPDHREVHTGDGAVGLAAAFVARGRAGWPPVPKATESIPELDRRTRELLERVQDVKDGLSDEVANRAAAEQAISVRLDEAWTRLDAQTRRVATGGIRLEAFGLFCVVLGLFCQLLAAATA